jgi:hypothetical protein
MTCAVTLLDSRTPGRDSGRVVWFAFKLIGSEDWFVVVRESRCSPERHGH